MKSLTEHLDTALSTPALSQQTTPIRWNSKLSKLASAFDRQIQFAPHVQTLHVRLVDYLALVNAISPEWQKAYGNTIRYRGRTVMPCAR